MAYYRNRTTGKVQFHPVSGLGDSFNADEIEETGRAIKPRTALAPSADELRDAKKLMKDNSPTPSSVEGVKNVADNRGGDSAKTKQKGAK